LKIFDAARGGAFSFQRIRFSSNFICLTGMFYLILQDRHQPQ
jgi:hypothetical protein